MKPLLLLLLLAGLSLAFGADTAAPSAQACLDGIQGGTAAEVSAQQQACCKANKGVCGCRAGRIVCCDKTFAEGCTCNREDDPPTS